MVLGICIKVLGHAKKRIAFIGDVIIISVRRIILKNFIKLSCSVVKNFLRVLCIELWLLGQKLIILVFLDYYTF